jgi:hypothetical protein
MFLDILATNSPLIYVLNRCGIANDEKVLPKETRRKIENKIKEISQKIGIQKEIRLIENRLVPIFCKSFVYGDMLFFGRPIIIINPKAFENIYDPSTLKINFLERNLACRIFNLKSNDNLSAPLFGCIVGLITFIALSVLFPHLAISLPYVLLSPGGIAGTIAAHAATYLFRCWRENCAFNNALSLEK